MYSCSFQTLRKLIIPIYAHTLTYLTRFGPQVKEKNSKPHIEVETSQGTKVFAPEEISAMVLGKMKETAEAYLGKKVSVLD